ncbi:polysaccharide biosynthesis tyrosine autokinase [Vibrio nitrifigilis]|uniref:Polysaccharide biosynthesis tyrosine autokinase n=1 Tax=Vibrio nitrifigilis TaxID=2789781 RepID=A0ABS0GFJ9_9VIBR|nr:polysaccharide biosynthesis tyrosine autokinase [Vibrio nitrifigilis]MBF9001183.1 polysaccharide biosynthesis tyrosine autokinase [Vibrio nitrifigilis]
MVSKQENLNNSSSDEINLSKIIGLLLDEKWLIVMVTSVFVVLGVAYAILATPIYKADALIQVEEKTDGGFSSLVGDMGDMFASESTAMTEIELITSRMILGQTVDKFHLTTVVKPDYFPVVGKGLARLMDEEEHLDVSQFDIPKYAKDMAHQVVITDPAKQTYKLVRDDGKVILEGKVGEREESQDGYQILVSSMEATKGFKFDISKRTELDAINWVNQNLNAAEKGKQTGVIKITYLDSDPDKAKAILNDIAQNYFLQNVERDSAEAEQSIKFLQKQLPQVKGKLNKSEDKLNDYRQKKESVDLSLEAQSALKTMVDIESQLNELTFKEADISKKYTKDHPAYKALLDKRQTLLEEKAKVNKKVQNLPETQREVLRMKRDVEVDQQIYIQLLNKIQELNIVKAGTVGNVRIIDNAETYLRPVSPKKFMIVIILTLMGGMLSVGIVLLKAILNKGVESPDDIEAIGLSVYATVPKSNLQTSLLDRRYAKDKKLKLLSEIDPTDLSVEALRGLRTSLHFAMMEAENNIVMISGSTPGIGKSFVSANFSAICAHADKRVVLVDADMRKGTVNRFFGVRNGAGLSDYLSGKEPMDNIINTSEVENLDVIHHGQIPPNPSELLMHARFKELMDHLSQQYDLVIVDTPPVLAVTDASIVGRLAGTTLMVTRFGVNTVKDIDLAWGRFKQAGIDVKGVVFNGAEKKSENYYYYEYSSDH